MKDLKSRFLAAIGHACKADESPEQAFDRLRLSNPDAFPVPRCNESFLEACADVVRTYEAGKGIFEDDPYASPGLIKGEK